MLSFIGDLKGLQVMVQNHLKVPGPRSDACSCFDMAESCLFPTVHVLDVVIKRLTCHTDMRLVMSLLSQCYQNKFLGR